MTTKQSAFVAYPGGDVQLAELISVALSRANAKPIPVTYRPWEFNDVPGASLISPIMEGIESSAFVVADITYLNLNVVYEIGYAIGKEKRVFLIRHLSTEGDRGLAKETGIFDTLGYFEYKSSDQLCERLTAEIEPLPLEISKILNRKAPVYVVDPETRGSAETITVSKVKKARYRFRSFNPTEDVRLAAVDAIRQVGMSAGILVHFQNSDIPGSRPNNVRACFVAGVSRGLEKPTLMLASAEIELPLDVRDDAKPYRRAEDITEHVQQWSLDINEYQQRTDPTPTKIPTGLQALRIGDPTAENEITTLADYYLQTDQYGQTLAGRVNLVVGRKGSGKTALFFQVRDRLRTDKRNVVLDLKPEAYQILKLKEDVLSYLSEGSTQHLITAFWEYLLLLEVANKLLENDKSIYKHNHLIYDQYLELRESYLTGDFSSEGDFSERLLRLSNRISSEYRYKYKDSGTERLTSSDVTELLYVHDIRKLRDCISGYLEHKRKVWVLFDNLDKGWSTRGVDVIDATVLRCLIDAGRKLEREMSRDGHEVHCIIFVRNDVYEHLMQNSADYGKEMIAVLDWTQPELLREMLRLRLVSGLSLTESSMALDVIIPSICVSHYKGEEVIDYMISLSLMRPRNLLKVFNYTRGFASNFNHNMIDEEDLNKGIDSYSDDLLLEFGRELSDVLPGAEDILYYLLDAPSELSKVEITNRICEAGVAEDKAENVMDFLIYYGVIGLKEGDRELYIYDVNYDPKKLEIRIGRAGNAARFCIHRAFWPSLDIVPQ
ncbi:MAG: P-loop ATPase, Sll1717 family [Ktedonobacteraceae bacterium]